MSQFRAAQLTTELSVAFAVPPLTGKEFEMPRPPRDISARTLARSDRDILHVQDVGKNTRAKPIGSHTTDPDWPPVPDLLDVITYFRARGDSFTLIASIGFWVGEAPKKALTARGLKLWYEGELERRAAAKASIR